MQKRKHTHLVWCLVFCHPIPLLKSFCTSLNFRQPTKEKAKSFIHHSVRPEMTGLYKDKSYLSLVLCGVDRQSSVMETGLRDLWDEAPTSFLTLCLQGAVDRGAGEYSPAVTSVILSLRCPFCSSFCPVSMMVLLASPLKSPSSELVFFRMPLTCTAGFGVWSSASLDCELERRTSLGLRLMDSACCLSERPEGRCREGSWTGSFCIYRETDRDRKTYSDLGCWNENLGVWGAFLSSLIVAVSLA